MPEAWSEADRGWMQQALALAQQSEALGEVPIGACVVRDGRCLGVGHNQPIAHHDPTAHAEVVALRDAAARVGNYRLPGATLYVTLEPCLMCAGALAHARIARVVFGAFDDKTERWVVTHGSTHPQLRHLQWEGGCEASACAAMLTSFFAQRREAERRG